MNGNGYGSMEKVLPSAFSKEQRTRLEALTAAKALHHNADSHCWIRLAVYIERGALP